MSAGFPHPKCRGIRLVCQCRHADPREYHSLVVNNNQATVVSYFSGIVSEHCCVPEGICEWQLYLQHLMGVQIQRQSDLGVTSIGPGY